MAERQLIEEVFRCKVTNRYCCECKRHEGLHLNMDYVVVELLRGNGTEATPGEEANIIVTDLVNRGMPLIR